MTEKHASLIEALVAIQGELRNPVKNATGKVKGVTKAGAPFEYDYRYVDLAAVLDEVRPIFAKHGVAIIQLPAFSDGMVHVETRFSARNSAGETESISSTLAIAVASGKAQDIGSAISYARRYGLQAMAGIMAEEDDDGARAQASEARKPRKNLRPETGQSDADKVTIHRGQFRGLLAAAINAGLADRATLTGPDGKWQPAGVAAYVGELIGAPVESLEALGWDEWRKAAAVLQGRIDEVKK